MNPANSPLPKPDLLFAPWSAEQVRALNAYQDSGVFHPFTSENGKQLIATQQGWVEEEGGPVVQTWAHPFMADADAISSHVQLMRGALPKRNQ